MASHSGTLERSPGNGCSSASRNKYASTRSVYPLGVNIWPPRRGSRVLGAVPERRRQRESARTMKVRTRCADPSRRGETPSEACAGSGTCRSVDNRLGRNLPRWSTRLQAWTCRGSSRRAHRGFRPWRGGLCHRTHRLDRGKKTGPLARRASPGAAVPRGLRAEGRPGPGAPTARSYTISRHSRASTKSTKCRAFDVARTAPSCSACAAMMTSASSD